MSRGGVADCVIVIESTPAAMTPVAIAANVVSRGCPVARSP